MQPRAEIVHWLFATGFLMLGLCLLAEAVVGPEVWARRTWRPYIWPGLAFFMGIAMSITLLARMAFFFGGGQDERNNPFGPFAFLIAWILAPLAAALIQMAVSRSREYQADQSGAELSRDPEALASALRKLEVASKRIPAPATVGPAEAHLFIVNPLAGRRVQFANLFSTHPPTEARIARLEHMAGHVG